MSFKKLFYISTILLTVSCRTYIDQEQTNYEYHDIVNSDTIQVPSLYAVTNEEYLQYGSSVAYVNMEGDTIIPFGNFAYFGTDTMVYFANVLLHPDDSTYGRIVGISQDQQILFDVVTFDIAPDPFNEGLTRVKRNTKMGYANQRGEIVIPCKYDYARWFKNGVAEVTFDAKEYYDLDEHLRVESDSWFEIDKQGKPIKTP
ncbi:MAG: WG repeat-containing protein [Cyclobacteriaceae bacterium]